MNEQINIPAGGIGTNPVEKPVESNEIKIPVLQEFVQVGKRVEEKGKVVITKQVVEEPAQLELEGTATEVTVQRRALNQFVDDNYPAVREEDGATVYSVFKEVLVKRLMLVEEVVVRHNTVHHTETQTVNLKREEIKIEREGSNESL